jgi:peptidoglycan/LPS O-acetylase OafA/YrhL
MATPARATAGAERIELTAVSGLRFFATAFMVMGRAIENLWIDEGTDAAFLSTTVCSGLHTGAKDMVSFYFMLSGFTMCWGYLNRDFESDEVRWRYWIRRFVRFYPDFAISSILTYIFKHPYFFGCHDYGWGSALSNAASLLLFSAWYRFIPGSGYRNGPVWFIVTLFWLWIVFPYLLVPVRATFRNSSWSNFLIKFGLLWAISLVPWAFITEENIDMVRWALRCFPPLRIPEFIMGMALAIRVSQDRKEQVRPLKPGSVSRERPGGSKLTAKRS